VEDPPSRYRTAACCGGMNTRTIAILALIVAVIVLLIILL
jgi:hypothetical protein